MDELNDMVAGLEATMAEMASIQTNYNDSVDRMVASTAKPEGELKDVRSEVGASVHRVPSDSKEKTSVTRMKGLEKLKVYTGEVSQWKDWRFKVNTDEPVLRVSDV